MAVTVIDLSGMSPGAVGEAVSGIETGATANGLVITSIASVQSGQVLVVVTGPRPAGASSPGDELAKFKKLADENAINSIDFNDAKRRILDSL